MDETMGNEGINKLAGVFQNRMKGISEKPAALDFGTINRDMSLTTNGFPQPIPKSDYVVCGSVGGRTYRIKAGDRVLVAWVGDDACIIYVIVSGNSL